MENVPYFMVSGEYRGMFQAEMPAAGERLKTWGEMYFEVEAADVILKFEAEIIEIGTALIYAEDIQCNQTLFT